MTALPRFILCRALVLAGLAGGIGFRVDAADAPEVPTPIDGSVKVTLFAAEPQVVTPIGATVDSHGRLLVIESHTHFRPKGYQGPASDRIRIFEDTTGTGKADRITTYFEGMNYLMNLVADRDGSIVVSSRNEIFRLSGSAASGLAANRVTVAHLETKADYPHNGLHGLAIGGDGSIYFGIGENYGGAYTLVGADGQKLSDDRGTGAIFRVDAKGNGLTRLAYGFWNPFGLGIDPVGNLWAVDNDPDGRPPCRLIQVAPGADYGFQFRYGRTGMHPLQAWDAELPGTLGMVAGVGEAPCAVLWHAGRHQLLVSSWRDHQVEGYSLQPRGATFTAAMTPILRGGPDFRPVGLATSSDGTLYVTDWASGSYPVHGKGRIWKVKLEPTTAGADSLMTSEARRAIALRSSTDLAELTAALDDTDPAISQAAQFGLSKLPAVEKIEWSSLKTPRQHIALLAALIWRGTDLKPFIAAALSDSDDRVRQMAVRAITEQGIKESLGDLEKSLNSQVMSPRLLGMTIAAIGMLNGEKAGKIEANKINSVLMARMNAPTATDETRAGALRMMLATHPHIPLDQIRPLLQSANPASQLPAVRYLNDEVDPARFHLLAALAKEAKADVNVRAEAIAGLSADAAAQTELLLQLAADSVAAIRAEALRSLRPIAADLTKPQQEQLIQIVKVHPTEKALVERLVGGTNPARPAETDLAAWQRVVEQTPGDADAGRRIFFHPSSAGCYRCHMLEGRGRAIGPDLTMIGHSQTREHVLESILDPSREIAPLFTVWTITTRNGQKYDGMLLRRDGQSKEVYVDSSGLETTIPERDIIDRKARKESLMPTGLVQALTDQELRDVIALLMEKR